MKFHTEEKTRSKSADRRQSSSQNPESRESPDINIRLTERGAGEILSSAVYLTHTGCSLISNPPLSPQTTQAERGPLYGIPRRSLKVCD